MREKLAKDMEYACANPKIGYDQSQNQTLWSVAKMVQFDCSRVKVACETDCARLVRVCCWYSGSKPADFYTGSEVSALKTTGDFDVYTSAKYCKSSDYLLRGDILVTPRQGHTVIVLSNGAKAGGSSAPVQPTPSTSSKKIVATSPAKRFNDSKSGNYVTTGNVNLRNNAGAIYKSLGVLPKGTLCKCYGYYSTYAGRDWLYVVADANGYSYTGFVSTKFLEKR